MGTSSIIEYLSKYTVRNIDGYLNIDYKDLELPEEWANEQKKMLTYPDGDDSPYRREILCETF